MALKAHRRPNRGQEPVWGGIIGDEVPKIFTHLVNHKSSKLTHAGKLLTRKPLAVKGILVPRTKRDMQKILRKVDTLTCLTLGYPSCILSSSFSSHIGLALCLASAVWLNSASLLLLVSPQPKWHSSHCYAYRAS